MDKEKIGRMRWDHATMSGKNIDDEEGNQLLSGFMEGGEWEELTERQRFCGYWESHERRGGLCILCGAKYIGENRD